MWLRIVLPCSFAILYITVKKSQNLGMLSLGMRTVEQMKSESSSMTATSSFLLTNKSRTEAMALSKQVNCLVVNTSSISQLISSWQQCQMGISSTFSFGTWAGSSVNFPCSKRSIETFASSSYCKL